MPNMLTLANLLMGCVAIQFSLAGNLVDATYFILIALVFDFFDGFAARAFQAHSDIGKDLDSLADMVSFGVAPTFLMYGLASHANYTTWPWGNPQLVGYICFAIAAASAFRLAKFNHDKRQSYGFIGLPTPANAVLICGLVWLAANPDSPYAAQLTNPYIILITVALCCWLPLSNISMIALKFKNFSTKDNLSKYILMAGSFAIVAIFGGEGLFYAVCFYILFSMLVPFIFKGEDENKVVE